MSAWLASLKLISFIHDMTGYNVNSNDIMSEFNIISFILTCLPIDWGQIDDRINIIIM